MKFSRINFKVRTGKSRIHGSGVYADEPIPARRKIGSMGGTIISGVEAARRIKARSIAIVELSNGQALDGFDQGNELSYINHSCKPNSYIRVIGVHVEFYALRKIDPREEITCDYGESHHEGKLPCQCGESQCQRYL